TLNGAETVLYSFTGGSDGGSPLSGTVRDFQGNLYGTTVEGGSAVCGMRCGVVFGLTPNGAGWSERVLYAFTGGNDGGGTVFSGLIRKPSGDLFGTVLGGKASAFCPGGCGVVFEVRP